jgi:hypothetical protein
MTLRNKTNTIEKIIIGIGTGAFLTAGYHAVNDFLLLEELSAGGLHCIVTDPRVVIPSIIGVGTAAVAGLYQSYRNKPQANENKSSYPQL